MTNSRSITMLSFLVRPIMNLPLWPGQNPVVHGWDGTMKMAPQWHPSGPPSWDPPRPQRFWEHLKNRGGQLFNLKMFFFMFFFIFFPWGLPWSTTFTWLDFRCCNVLRWNLRKLVRLLHILDSRMPPKYLTGHAIQGSNIEKNKQTISQLARTGKRPSIHHPNGHLQMATIKLVVCWWCSKPTVEAIQDPRDPSMAIFSLPASERVMPETSETSAD